MSDESKIHNPILRGFNPDPSIVRVGDDYYIATSTFEWFPGVQIHHSRDLLHWRLLTRPLNRASQLNMLGDPDSCGVWAPCLTHAEGLFWLIYTDVKRYGRTTVGGASGASLRDFHNFLVTSPRIDGEWSDPVYLNSSGFDPSLFHDDDGRKYLLNQLWDHRPGHNRFAGIVLQEFSAKEGKLVGERVNIFKGTALGLTEAPHLYQRGGWYYLLTAEGGTGFGHAVTMARSRKIAGPYELHPDTYILSARNRPDAQLQRAGHADLVETQDGATYLVYLCGRPLRNRGRCTLGRETAIQKMVWGQDGWLRAVDGQGIPTLETPAPKLPPHVFPNAPLREDFNSAQLPIDFQWLRTPRPAELFSVTARPGFLRLYGRETIGSLFRQALLARRQQSHCFTVATVVEFEPQHFQQSAGLVCYYNSAKFHYFQISHDETLGKHLRVMTCSPDSPQTDSFTPLLAIPGGKPVHLRVEVDYERLYFAYRVEGVDQDWVWLPQQFDASILSDEASAPGQPNFTGAFVGMACQDMSGAALPADFDFFEYEERDYRVNPLGSSPSVLKQILLLLALGWLLGAFGILPSRGASIFSEAREFIGNNCADCHDATTKEAGLDLTALSFEPEDKANFATWVKVHDRVKAGEMPPKKKKTRPEPAAVESFVKSLASTLTTSEQAIIARDGRAMQRRLNRYEYENTLRDLLGVPWTQLRNRLPEDGEAYRFSKSGEALDVSHVQMSRYMSVADYAIRQAISVQLERPPATTNRYDARNEPSLTANFRPRENGTLPDRFSFPVLDSHAQPEVRAGRAPISDPASKEREAIGKVSSIFSDAGSYSWGQFRAPVAGRYRLRFSGYSIWVSGGGIGRWFYEGQGEQKAPVYYLPLWHRPNLDEVWPGRRDEPIGVYAQSSGQSRPLGEFDFTPVPGVQELETILNPNEVIQTDGLRLFRTRVSGSDEQYVNPLAQKDGMPGYAVQWIEVEGPLSDESTGAGYRVLFGDLPLKRLEAGQKGVMVEVSAPPQQAPIGTGPRGGRAGGFGGRFAPRTRPVAVEVVTENPQKDAERLLRTFMKRAYRSPVKEAHLQRFLALFNDQFDKGFGFAKSMVSAYTAVLSSPGFIFTDEKPGRLDDYALASRLSFFLWNSEPDETLRSLAAHGELHQPEVLRAQTERLLNDAKSARFVEAFTDYWLDLRKIDDTSPSTTLYNDYELDDPLKLAAMEETRLFVAELFGHDLPARNIVDSDFTFLNERLASHYGLPGVKGAKMRKVSLPKNSVRGGLMTQASVLKVTANGTTTSPVLRGYWITERIMGYQIPPPPPVASVEPDIRGAVTLRQQLEKHRNNASCAACHSKMDPPGFALESFDVMGAWRDRYRAVKEGVKPEVGFGLSGQPFAFYYALPVDCAGDLSDGRAFKDIRDFKRLLLQDEVPIARNLAKQLTIYATGAPVRFSDREQIEKIVQLSRSSQFGLRTLVHEIIQSDLFQMK